MSESWDGFVNLKENGNYRALVFHNKKQVAERVFPNEGAAVRWMREEKRLRVAAAKYGTKRFEL